MKVMETKPYNRAESLTIRESFAKDIMASLVVGIALDRSKIEECAELAVLGADILVEKLNQK